MNMASEMLVLLNLGRVYQEKVTINFKETGFSVFLGSVVL